MSQSPKDLTGGCVCGAVRYRLTRKPLIVHCCHCGECQRETGSAFAVNAMIEGTAVTLEGETPVAVPLPTASGNPHSAKCCPTCQTTVWTEYSSGERLAFIRVGTLDDPQQLPPDIHIFTNYKQPWVPIPEGALSVPEFYDYDTTWPAESLGRIKKVFSPPEPS